MVIRFVVNDVFGGWMPDAPRLGGTEDAVVEWAKILARENRVQVFSNFFTDDPFSYRDAMYFMKKDYLEQAGIEKGITIFVNEHRIPVVEPSLYLTNETDADKLDLTDYELVIQPTQWAVDNVKVNQKVKIIPYGYHPSRVMPYEKVRKQCLYASSPDRGLDTLNLIWGEVVKAHPDATLIVTYGGQIDTPNTRCVGSVTEAEMDKLYRTSDIWLHPCNGGEMYCISGIKAQAAGAIPVYFPMMALAETVKEGICCSSPRDMLKKLIDILGDEDEKNKIRRRLANTEYPTWESTAEQLEGVILDLWKTQVE